MYAWVDVWGRGIGGDLDEHSQDILVHSRILSRNIGFHK